MPNKHNLTLFADEYGRNVAFHTDILDNRPAALSLQRSKKPNQMVQTPYNPDDATTDKCRLCHPTLLAGSPDIADFCDGKVGVFENAAPYLPLDQRLAYLKHPDQATMERRFHTYQIGQIRRMELYYLLKTTVELGKRFAQNDVSTTDLPRMIAGFNIGPNAGQSLSHIHMQYGWEVSMENLNVLPEALQLFFEELHLEGLVLHSSSGHDKPNFKLVVPWTPRGQYALDIYFTKQYEIHKLEETDIKVFAWLGHRILETYRKKFRIQNVNIVFDSSPLGRCIVPVRARFVPRVNMTALYEVLGVDVVDTPPSTIFNEMRGIVPNWQDAVKQMLDYNPSAEYESEVANADPLPFDTEDSVRAETPVS